MSKKTFGPLLLIAIDRNTPEKVHDILAKQVHNKAKARDLCTSDIKRLPAEVFDCPLLLAATLEDPTIIKYMVEKHEVNINFVHQEGTGRRLKLKTALILAVHRGLYDTVEGILSVNADPNIQDQKGRSALHHAVRRADYRMAKMLLIRGAQPNLADKNDNTPLHVATIFGHAELVKLLLRYDADLYRKGQHGAIPIHIAASEGHVSLLRVFCERGVNVNVKVPCYDGREKTPLHAAVEHGHVETAMALIGDHGADVNGKDSEGETPLHCTVLRPYDQLGMRSKDDFVETAKLLLRYGADMDASNGRGETPMHLAARNELHQILDVLVRQTADPLIEDNDGHKAIDLVPDDEIVIRQTLKSAMQDRERIMNEVLEVRARGFSTSASSMPLKSLSAMHMPSVGTAPMARTASTPGLFAGSQMVPATIYEEGYLQPLSSRQNLADAAKDEQASAGNTYATIESGTEVTPLQKDPLMTKSPRKRRSRENLLRIRAAKQELSSDSSQYGEIPAAKTTTAAGGKAPRRQPSNSSSTTSDRALPSPPRSPSDAHRSYLTQRTMSETSSLWEVTPRGSMISFMKDFSPEAKPKAWRPQEVVIQRSDSMPGSEGGAAAGVKVTKTGKPVIDIQPARGRGKSNESDSDDTYFDDESFDTLDTLSDDSMPPKEEKRKPSPPPKRTAKDPQLHNWLQEQAGMMRQNDLAGPVAHSTPPATRATTTRKFKTVLAAPAESDEDRHPPPRAQSTPPPSGESRRRPPPPTPPSDGVVKVADAKDITIQINDDTAPGTTVITVSKKSTATATKPLISKKPNVAIENRKNQVPLSANADLKTATQENNNEADVVNAQSISNRIAAFESGSASPAKVAPAAGKKEGRPPPPMSNVQKTATEKETRALPPPPTARSTPPQEACKPAPLQWEKVSLNSDAGIYWEHTTTEDVYACKNLGQVTTVEREETASDATDDVQRPVFSPDTSLSESTDDDDDDEEDIPNSGHQVAMMYDVSTVEENFNWVTYNIYRDPAAKRNASQSSIDHAEPSRHVVAANASSVGDNRVNQPHDNAAPCVGGDSNRAGKVCDPFQLELLTRVNKLAAGESAKTNGVVANEDIYHEIPDHVREPTHQQQQQQQQQTQRQQYPQQSQQQPVLVNQLHAQQQQQQQPEKLQQQAQEQQRQAHQPADQQQQQLLPPPHKRHVTIGSEEIIPNNRQRASDFDHRRVVYDSAGKMRISIVGGNAEGVFVHRIDPGSDADMQGLMEGDEILSVNGKSLKGKTKEEATLLLMSMRGKVDLLVRHRRDRYDHIVDNGGMGDAFFVRAHFKHERSQPHDLSVHEGDIFSVRETLPSGKMGSWNAVKVTARANESQEGLIPNRHRAEQIALTRRLEDSRRAAKEKDQQRGGFLRRSFRRSKSLDRLNKIAKEKYVSDEQTPTQGSPDAFIAYERVQQQAPGFRRPVVLLGVFCDVVRDRLAADSPGLFEIPCGEIEVAVSRGRGGLADSPPIDVRPIRAAMSRNKHCLMIASPRVVQHLTKANLHPVVIYMAAGNRGVLKSIRAKLAPDFPGKASAMMEEAAAFERQHSELLTATVSYTTNEGWFSLLKDTIKRVQNQALWQTVSDDADGDDDLDGEDPDISLSVESPATGAAATAARMKLNRSTDDIPDTIDDILARRDGPDTAHLDGDMRRPNRLQSYDGYSLPDRGPSGAAGTANAAYPKQLSGSELAGHKPKSILKKNSSYSRSCGNINGESDSLSSTSSYTTYSDAVYQQQQKQVAMHTRPPPLRNAVILAAVGADQQRMTSQGAGQQRQTGRRGARPAGPRARADSRETPL